MSKFDPSPIDNALLAEMPRHAFASLAPHLVYFSADPAAILIEADQEIEEVFFPTHGMVCLYVVRDEAGVTVETGKIGRNGVVGAMAGLGLKHSRVRAVAAIQTAGFKVAASSLRKMVKSDLSIMQLCIHFNEILLDQARAHVANSTLLTEARYCRWLLDARDCCGEDKALSFTQDLIAKNLNFRRTSVTAAVSRLRDAGVIDYARGTISISDLEELKKRAGK